MLNHLTNREKWLLATVIIIAIAYLITTWAYLTDQTTYINALNECKNQLQYGKILNITIPAIK